MQKTAVIGAAGTGKTCFMIESVSRLLKEEIVGGRVLILASSARAVNDIRARLNNVCPDAGGDDSVKMAAPALVVHTVSSLCEAVVKDSKPELQILSNFRSWFILRECIRSDSVPIHSSYIHVKDKRSFAREMLELMELASVNSISIDQLPSGDQAADKLEDIKNINRYYRDFCQQRGLVPAFDVIPEALDLLSDYGEQFSHVFIDQYEDLYPGEIQAINSLIGEHTDVTICMDAGSADIPSAQFSEIEDVRKLDGTRSRLSPSMSGHVNRLLKKVIYSTRGQDIYISEGDEQPLTIAVEETAVDEAENIARTIKKECAGRKYSDFAILCREVENSGGAIRDALKRYSIPCSGGVDLSHDPGVLFVLLSLRVIAEPHEDDVVLKWLSSPIARLDRADVYRAYSARSQKREFFKTIAGEGSLFHKSGDRLKEILSVLDLVKSELQSGRNVWELVEPILAKSGAIQEKAVTLFIEMIQDIEMSYEKKRRLPELLNDIREALTYISEPDELIREDGDAVRIMSISESKGLEFPFVFVPGMTSDFFPARQLLYGEDMEPARAVLRGIDLPGTVEPARWREQERHLLYIAMTRSKEKLYLTFARQYPDREDCEPSPFLIELLEGRELSADSCAHYGIDYQDHTVSNAPDELPSPGDIISRADLEIACYRYIRELERLDHQKAAKAIELLSSTGAVGDLLHPEPAKETALPHVSARQFSSTAMRNFLSCPRRYFLSYLLRVESEDRASAHFGRLVHDVLSKFHKEYPVLSEYSLEELWTGTNEILSEMWDNRKEPGFAGNQLQARSYLRLAGEILQAYLQGEYSRWDESRTCVLAEKNFNFRFDEYSLRGRIDRVDICAPDGGNEIMDFKTSAYDTEGEAAMKSKFLNMDDDPDYQPQDFQLPVYYFASMDDGDLDPQKLVIYQLRNFSRSSGTPFRRELEILPDEDTRSGKKDKFLTKADLESVKGDILWTLERMVSGLYPPEPRDDNVCERECDFSFLCDREESEDH